MCHWVIAHLESIGCWVQLLVSWYPESIGAPQAGDTKPGLGVEAALRLAWAACRGDAGIGMGGLSCALRMRKVETEVCAGAGAATSGSRAGSPG